MPANRHLDSILRPPLPKTPIGDNRCQSRPAPPLANGEIGNPASDSNATNPPLAIGEIGNPASDSNVTNPPLANGEIGNPVMDAHSDQATVTLEPSPSTPRTPSLRRSRRIG